MDLSISEYLRVVSSEVSTDAVASQVNRGIIRDDGALDEIVNRLLHLSENLYNAPGGDGDMPDMDVRDEDGEDLGAGDTAKASAGYF